MGGGPAPTGTATTGGGTTTATPPQGGGMSMMLLLPLLLLVFIMVQAFMSSKREKKARATLLSTLRKHDKVLTVGGIIATVVEINDHDVVLKIDENSNARVRFTKQSIQQVLTPSGDRAPAADDLKVEVKANKGERATV